MLIRLPVALAALVLLAACGAAPEAAAAAPIATAPPVTAEPMTVPESPAPQPPAPTAVDNPPPPAPAAAPAAALRAGYARQAGRTLISASATGLSPGVHAFHLHAGCDGRPSAHIATLTPLFAGAGGTAATTTAVPASLMVAGETVIVYPGPDPVGVPVLCARL